MTANSLTGLRVAAHRPWPRLIVEEATWLAAAEDLAAGRWTLSGLWADDGHVHMALSEERGMTVLTLPCPERRFPSIGRRHPPAIRLERAIFDLFGYTASDAADTRPWLDHGRWDVAHPLGAKREGSGPARYEFLPAEGEGIHQIPVGPVHAGIIEPGHFRFHAHGETVVRLEARLGYTHKGVDFLMRGAEPSQAAKLAGRVSGDSTVAYAIAFARATEAALEIEAPPRALWLRALMAELERLANHLGDIGAIANDASFSLMFAHCGVLRERVLRTADCAFGHRLMRDCVIPGGVARNLDDDKPVRALLAEIRRHFPHLVHLYDNTASLQDRTVGAGIVQSGLAQAFGAGGYIGRASGRSFDARKAFAYPPYDRLRFEVPVLSEGDVNARVWIRIREIDESMGLIDQILAGLPAGAIRTEIPRHGGEGLALAEGFRGDILASIRLDAEGRIARCHMRDPSWFQWPLLEAAIEGNIVADFPLCNKSFNCSYSGSDL